jgi:hypothetical protein
VFLINPAWEYNRRMKRWTWLTCGLALSVAVLAACTRTAPPGPPLPTLAPLATAQPTLAAAPSATAEAALTATDPPTAAPPSPTRTLGPSSPTPWPTIQTATPLFLADLPTLAADASATLAVPPPATPVGPATLAAATQPAGPAAPSITTFSISPAEILPGQPVTLTWQTNAEQVTLQRLDMFGRLGEFFSVAASGTQVLSTPAEQRGSVTFMLFAATGGEYAQASAQAVILCPDSWFFANPPAVCPASPPHATAMQAQRFERGLMLWTQYNDFIYALYADGGYPRWDGWANAWFPGQPESDPSLLPPAGAYQPVRGFGLAWRTGYVSPTEVVRDRLGWAIEPESSVPNAQVQCDSLPKYSRCYLTGPGGVVYVLHPERSGWEEWQ